MDFGNILKAWGSKKRPHTTAVIVAAGDSSRMGSDKLSADLGGKPVLFWSLRAFNACGAIDEIVVVTRQEKLLAIDSLCRANELDKVRSIVAGGQERIDSVLAGLESVSSKTRLVAVHDGARPFVSDALITAAVKKAKNTGAAAPAIRVKDTVKRVANGVVVETPDRNAMIAIQTPQVFDSDLLLGALYKVKEDEAQITDDCMAVERLGMKVHITEGDERNFKLTTPLDLALARLLVKEETL